MKIGRNVEIKYSKYSNPQKAILSPKYVYKALIGDDSSAGATFRRAKEKRKKTPKTVD